MGDSDEVNRETASSSPFLGSTHRDREDRRVAQLLRSAQAGDERAFRDLVTLHRPAVLAHCYRMLGSLHDAEDAFQDTLLRAWRSIDSLAEERAFQSWLFRIATNVCLTTLRGGQRRALPVDLGAPLRSRSAGDVRPDASESWIEPLPDDLIVGADIGRADPAARYEQREAIELAFIAALQHLPARQRAALILADVLGFSAAAVATFLDTTVVAVNSALQRSRETLRSRLPERSQQVTARQLGNRALDELAARFVEAFEAGDPAAILALLTDDVAFEMPPYRGFSAGRGAVGSSWLMPSRQPAGLRLVRTSVNAQLAFGVYTAVASGSRWRLVALDVVTIDDAHISRVVAFRSPDALARCGLPTVAGERFDGRHPDGVLTARPEVFASTHVRAAPPSTQPPGASTPGAPP